MLVLFPFLSVLTIFLAVTILLLYSNYRDRAIVSCSTHWEQMSVLSIWCILFLSPHGSGKTEKGLLELHFISLWCSDMLSGSNTVYYDHVLQLSCSSQIIQRVIFLKCYAQLENILPFGVGIFYTNVWRYSISEIPSLKVRKCFCDHFKWSSASTTSRYSNNIYLFLQMLVSTYGNF